MLIDKLRDVCKKVHKNYKYETDEEKYGELEKWVHDSDITKQWSGDCEDFAMSCRKLLNDQNIKSRLVFCRFMNDGELVNHLVTEAEGWILDCNFQEPMSRNQLTKDYGYIWVYISSFEPGGPWFKIVS